MKGEYILHVSCDKEATTVTAIILNWRNVPQVNAYVLACAVRKLLSKHLREICGARGLTDGLYLFTCQHQVASRITVYKLAVAWPLWR